MKKIFPLFFMAVFNLSSLAQKTTTIFYDVTIVDIEGGKLLKHRQVFVAGNEIISIKHISKRKLPGDTKIINAKGKYLIPGLWDMHVHTLNNSWYKWQFPLFLANGVTGFREMWGNTNTVDTVRQEMQNGTIPFFHFTASRHIIDGAKVAWGGSLSARDTVTAVRLVDSLIKAKVDFIKIYSNLRPDVFEAIARTCRERNFAFAGHVPNKVWITTASDAGMGSMEHLFGFLVEACSVPDSAMKLTKNPIEDNHDFILNNFSPVRMRNIARVLKEKNTYITPTLVTLRGYYFANDTAFTNDKRIKYLHPEVREHWRKEIEDRLKRYTYKDLSLMRKRYELEKTIIKILYEEKVPIMAGTDSPNPCAFPGFSLHDEIALYVEFGMKPIDALRTVTINPVKYLKMTDSLGTIQKGKRADIVLLNGNPLADITNTKNIYAVMLNGKLFTSKELDEMKEIVVQNNSGSKNK